MLFNYLKGQQDYINQQVALGQSFVQCLTSASPQEPFFHNLGLLTNNLEMKLCRHTNYTLK